MAEFIHWLNSETAQQQHPINYAAEAHCRFVEIHPFQDGNGRTGRLLMNLVLLRLGYPVIVIQNKQRAGYINALVQAQQHNRLLAFQTLILEAVQRSLIEVLQVVATATESQYRGQDFYRAMVRFLETVEADE